MRSRRCCYRSCASPRHARQTSYPANSSMSGVLMAISQVAPSSASHRSNFVSAAPESTNIVAGCFVPYVITMATSLGAVPIVFAHFFLQFKKACLSTGVDATARPSASRMLSCFANF